MISKYLNPQGHPTIKKSLKCVQSLYHWVIQGYVYIIILPSANFQHNFQSSWIDSTVIAPVCSLNIWKHFFQGVQYIEIKIHGSAVTIICSSTKLGILYILSLLIYVTTLRSNHSYFYVTKEKNGASGSLCSPFPQGLMQKFGWFWVHHRSLCPQAYILPTLLLLGFSPSGKATVCRHTGISTWQ